MCQLKNCISPKKKEFWIKWAEVLWCPSVWNCTGLKVSSSAKQWKSSLDAEHKRWECWTLFILRLKVSLDANQLLLGVFCLAIHQANVPLNQQLMSQTHTVCSFTMGHFTAPTLWRKWEKMMRKEKKKHKRDGLKRERNKRKDRKRKMISVQSQGSLRQDRMEIHKLIFIVHAGLNNNLSAYSCWRCHNVSYNITSVKWVTVEWKTNALAKSHNNAANAFILKYILVLFW